MKSATDQPILPLDGNVLPRAFVHYKTSYLNHGKQIVRNHKSRWICASVLDMRYRDRNWLVLWIGNASSTMGSEFEKPIRLVGRSTTVDRAHFESDGNMLGGAGVVIDRDDRLWIAYEQGDGVYVVSADSSSELADAKNWSAPKRIADKGSVLGDILVDGKNRCVVYFTLADVLYETPVDGTATKVCEHAVHPVAHVDAGYTTHLAFERDRRIYYLRRAAAETQWTDSRGNKEAEIVAHFCSSWPSIATTTDGKAVIAYQGEGKAVLYRDWQLYDVLRDAAGSTISYAVLADGKWMLDDLLRSHDIVLHRRPHHRHPQADPRTVAFMEEIWRPSLSIDRHGVLWMFYVNTTRRHIYWSRFDGQRFGERYEARGAFDCLERELFVQKEARGQDAIGFVARAAKQLYFDAISVPSYASTDKRRVVFLDNLEVDHVANLEHCLGAWQKHPEPLFGAGISGGTSDDHPAWCQVYKRDGGFEMQYMAFGEKHHSNSVPGRAFSKDGLRWEKRTPFDHRAMTLDGKPFLNAFWRPVYLEDPDERDPKRRFKGLLGMWENDGLWEKRWYRTVASPDAMHWHMVEGIDPVVVGDIIVNTNLIRDNEDLDPNRRYKILSCSGGQSGRCVAMFTSPDLLHWHDTLYLRDNPDDPVSAICPYPTGPAPLDADGAEHLWEEELHGADQWRENGLLMFHYDSFYFGANQHVEKALAISRDGRHYWRVKRGAINLPHGPCGGWDSGRVRTSHPIRVGDELWMYYCGMPASYFDDPDEKGYVPPVWADAWSKNTTSRGLELRPWRAGLAKLRVDGWGYFQLARDAEHGELTTIPFEYKGGQLVVNGSGLGEGGIRVEMRSADNTSTIAGFETSSCKFSHTDSVNSVVTWAGNKKLAPGSYRLRFTFEGLRSKLYAFNFK